MSRYEQGLKRQIEYNKPYWEDINVGAHALGPGASAPSLVQVAGSNIYVLAFNGNATLEQSYGSLEMLHNYKEHTDIRPHVHWSPTTNAAGNVKWFFEYTIANMGETFTAAQTISAVSSSNGIPWQNINKEIGIIPSTLLKIGSIVSFRLYRDPTDAADTYPDNAALLSVGIHYEINTPGSRQVAIK